MNNKKITIATDISKNFLDIYNNHTKKVKRFNNNLEQIKVLLQQVNIFKDNIFNVCV